MSIQVPFDPYGGTPLSEFEKDFHFRDERITWLRAGTFYLFGTLHVVKHDIGRSRNNVILATTAGLNYLSHHRGRLRRSGIDPDKCPAYPMLGCLYMRTRHFIDCLSSDKYMMDVTDGRLSQGSYQLKKKGIAYHIVRVPTGVEPGEPRYIDLDLLQDQTIESCIKHCTQATA